MHLQNCFIGYPHVMSLPKQPFHRDRGPLQLPYSNSLNTLAQSHDRQPIAHRESHDFRAIPISTDGECMDVVPSYLLGIPMHKLSRPVQFGVCSSGVIFFYLLYGYSQVYYT